MILLLPLYEMLQNVAHHTAILIIIEGHETASNGFQYQFTTGKPVENLKLTLNYHENGSTVSPVKLVLKTVQSFFVALKYLKKKYF